MAIDKYKEALEDSLEALNRDPSQLKAVLRASECYCKMGQMQQALELLDHVQGDGRAFSDELQRVERLKNSLETAESKFSNGDFVTASNLLIRLLEEMPEYLRTVNHFAECVLTNKDCIDETTPLLGASDSTLLLHRGTALFYLNRLDLALRTLQEAMPLDPDNATCLQMYKKVKKCVDLRATGYKAFENGRFKEAYELYSSVIIVDDRNTTFIAVLNGNRAAAAMKLGMYKEADEESSKSWKLNQRT